MLDQRRRRWANIVPTLAQRLEFAGEGQNIIIRAKYNGGAHNVGFILN